ncbi:hypothetical protein MAR_011394 [Mya arenaria]|uniref:Tenascin-X n=1 Tax=Mya arenaria TaxID=6604 RepID=A0ABY7FTY6_MYAAR|nr:hypothetical protein MAR_011394 [Mya arenaria]
MKATFQYGNIFEESTWGSGGGSYTVGGNNGGIGGGYIHMYATEDIIISGTVRADGKASSLTGNIYCNGGVSSSMGGGGAGGRVHAFFQHGDFHSGLIQAKGAIVHLQPPSDNYVFEFTHVELYGGAHLTLNGTGITLKTDFLYGDDSAHLHLGPGHKLEQTEVSQYRRTNISYEVFLYEGATWVWPDSTVEFRRTLDQRALGMDTGATSCSSRPPLAESGEISTERSRISLFRQDEGTLELLSGYGSITDKWTLIVRRGSNNGQLTIEAGGVLKARNLLVQTDIIKVDALGILTASGSGKTDGDGAGANTGGGSFGGRGGNGNGGVSGNTYGEVLPIWSGGSSASTTSGTGGGAIELEIAQILLVEGTIEASEKSGSSAIGGGSGGSILANTREFAGSEVSGWRVATEVPARALVAVVASPSITKCRLLVWDARCQGSSVGFTLQAYIFDGDSSASLHIGPDQLVIVQHPEDLEFLVNVYVYEGGKLVFPTDFICHDVSIYVWGTLGAIDMTVGEGCSLYLGSSGTSTRTDVPPNPGTFDMDSLTVSAGGEITATHDLTGRENRINIGLNIQGGGIVHAIHVNIEAQQLIVDDLGEIIGDFHNITCSVGEGVQGTAGSGRLTHARGTVDAAVATPEIPSPEHHMASY